MNVPLNIEEFIKLANEFTVIDVRSPAEFEQGHIPGAHNIPLFDNDERAKVGTAYKQTGRQKAIEIGLELVGPKLSGFIQKTKEILRGVSSRKGGTQNDNQPETILVHCWRGGMRSENFAHLLNVYGYKTHTLIKGYKAYRNFVLKSFESEANIIILGGETGSGKTEILNNLFLLGEQIINLEMLANHKGSAFGSLGEKPQPTQEQFENNLSHALSHLDISKRIWLEDESRSIGTCQLPNPIWEKMKQAPIMRVNIPKQERIERLMNDYGKFSREELANCILKIEKRLGPQHAKQALEELEKGNLREVADITLTYYDKAYNYNHEKRNFKDVFVVECESANANLNAKKILKAHPSLPEGKEKVIANEIR
ncbi:MAG: tRNA 2-selenouridine(34) synthase MnmH [Bacteroidetes bacterium]|nr:tRNA 2-selenouridine(34) synthase MnmH [Bacteroidota bacterium]